MPAVAARIEPMLAKLAETLPYLAAHAEPPGAGPLADARAALLESTVLRHKALGHEE